MILAFEIFKQWMLYFEPSWRAFEAFTLALKRLLECFSILDAFPSFLVVIDECSNHVERLAVWLPNARTNEDFVFVDMKIETRCVHVFSGFVAEMHTEIRFVRCLVF